MNHLMIVGNLTRDPELRNINTANGPVNICDFTVAVNDRKRKGPDGQPEATFFRCTAWRGLADVISKYAAKGTKVVVTGSVSCRTYQGNDGVTRASLEVQVEDFEFASSSGNRQTEAAPAEPAPAKKPELTPVSGEDLPF